MLPVWHIEELEKLRREQDEEREGLRLPLYIEEFDDCEEHTNEEPQNRGVVIIQL